MKIKPIILVAIFISAMQEIAMAEIYVSTNTQVYFDQINEKRSLIKKELQFAKSQKDMIKSNCLNDKLNQIDSAIRLANNSNILSIKERIFRITSEKCTGASNIAPIIINNSVQMLVDPKLPYIEDVNINNFISEPPSCVSCIK